MYKPILALLGWAAAGTGCVAHYSHSISASNSTQGTPVSSEARGFGYLLLTVPDLDASTELKAKCATGKLSNVETIASMRDWFVVQDYTVQAHAVCNP